MNIGPLRKRIMLQSPTRVLDGMGGHTVTYSDQIEAWAAFWTTSVTERIEGGQQVMTVIQKVRIRYRGGVHPSWRIRYGDRYFAIVGIVNKDERNRVMDLVVKEAVA
jgi:SPP1 family predicted phage head-tail adaptor